MTVISRQQPRRITDIYVISSLFFDKTVSNLDGNRASFRSGDEGRRHVSEGDLEQEEGRLIIYDVEHNGKQEEQVSKKRQRTIEIIQEEEDLKCQEYKTSQEKE
mmetsp:Transcript_3397/g.4606  ORF Transcript_3397/g.4606 Transcript_3397/m.4606 type:complete len:104 (+) Transcript_3397:3-314(+)